MELRQIKKILVGTGLTGESVGAVLQARAMADALAERSIPHALLMFEGESHGFRRAETIIRAIEAEYVFACQIFGIEPSGDFAPVDLVS